MDRVPRILSPVMPPDHVLEGEENSVWRRELWIPAPATFLAPHTLLWAGHFSGLSFPISKISVRLADLCSVIPL